MRVISADDDDLSRTTLGSVLFELGHDALILEDGLRAWQAFEQEPAPLVILSLDLPGLDGLEVCRRIRAHPMGAASFVLVVTARDGIGDLAAVLDAGADDYISKPASPKGLQARIEIARRRIEQADAHRSAEAALARARWLAGIGETALAMELEIGRPLSTILERADALLADDGFDADQREQLGIISEQARRLAGVIGRAVNLESPQSVEYLAGARMIDLSGPAPPTEH